MTGLTSGVCVLNGCVKAEIVTGPQKNIIRIGGRDHEILSHDGEKVTFEIGGKEQEWRISAAE